MENKSMAELRAKVIEGGIINQEGTVSATAINYVSGLYTSPLLHEVWGLAFHNIEIMDKLLCLMKEADAAEKYDVFAGILKTLYVITGMDIPDELYYIFKCDGYAIKQVYCHEFLEDFADLMYDYRAEADEEAKK